MGKILGLILVILGFLMVLSYFDSSYFLGFEIALFKGFVIPVVGGILIIFGLLNFRTRRPTA